MNFKKTLLSCSVASLFLVMSGSASASGFALIEQSASGLGNAFAGGAAGAEDASTVFFNPAGMTRLNGKQVAVAGHFILPSAKFNGVGGANTISGGDAGGLAFAPNAYFVMEVKPGVKAGIGLNAPFGLQTEYNQSWQGKYLGIKSKLQTINLNPSVAFQVNDALSLGLGLDYQHISGELSNYGGPILGNGTVKGTDNAWGYNLGALYNLNSTTRIGAAYRSAISYNLKGSLLTSLPFANGPVSLAVKLPDTFSLSAFHQSSDSYEIMADVTWTGWSAFKQVNVLDAKGVSVTNTIENWRNTVRASVGATHHYNDHWSARAGLAYDQTPVTDAFRTVRVPDSNRTWLALGGQYKPGKDCAVDFGYAHLFMDNAAINQASPGSTLTGSYKNSVDILSVQYTYSF
jgi:long-chain fatty acid transport protein